MGFTSAKKTTIEFKVKGGLAKATRVKNAVFDIISHVSVDDLELLAKAVKKPALKTMALAELRRRV